MQVEDDLTRQLEVIASTSNQRDRTTSYLSLLQNLLTTPNSSSLISFGRHFTTSSTMALVVGKRVFGIYVLSLCTGSGLDRKDIAVLGSTSELDDTENGVLWEELAQKAFMGEKGEEIRREVVEGVLEGGAAAGWADDQTTVLRKLHAHLLSQEEDWLGAARALMQIPLEGSRIVSNDEKLSIYMQIIRLLLECGESGQAQTYYSRASLLVDSETDKVTRLQFRLSQARLFDFSARFNEAAQRYHELSFDSDIDEGDRSMMLKSAVTTSILAPAGPQRSRILAALTRDERTSTSLPPHLPIMLRKMLLEYIVKPEEVREFETGLEEHQRAGVEGGGTVLERAVREHNIGACGKVYDNISFEALGAKLNLDAEAAEITARKMIEQGRLRAWIDQPLHLLYFENRTSHDTDADAQGTAGGLGVEREEKDIEPISWTERWDDRIRETSMKVESLAAGIVAKGLVPPAGAAVGA